MAKPALSITALSVEDTAKILRRAGGRNVSVEAIQGDIEAGAPVNADGAVNFIHYAAWLAKEAASRGD